MSVIRKQPGYSILLVLTVLGTLAAVSTVLPDPSASKACMLGYEAHCPFAPVSTLLCLAISLGACLARVRFFVAK
jgi:hypothetical protein